MRFMKSLPWNRRGVPLYLIVAAATVVAMFALLPSLVQGQANESPATMKECKEELAAGRAVLCKGNSFSVKTILPDGGYHINWSQWASRHSNVDRYTIQRLRFLYRYNFELEADGTHDLLASEVEMHLYYITVHYDDETTLRRYEVVDGGPFDDRQ